MALISVYPTPLGDTFLTYPTNQTDTFLLYIYPYIPSVLTLYEDDETTRM